MRDRYDTRGWDENRRSGSNDWDRDREYGYGQQGYNRDMSGDYGQGYGGYGQNQGQRYQGGYGQNQGYGGGSGYGQGTAFYDVYAIWWTPGQFTGQGPKNYQRSDDRIKEDVSERLQQSGQIDAHEIEVDVSKGIVTLKGTVPDRGMKRMAEDAVDSCSGVKDVHNELRVEDHDHDQHGHSTGQSRSSDQSGEKDGAGSSRQSSKMESASKH